jgi:hypothetical protein
MRQRLNRIAARIPTAPPPATAGQPVPLRTAGNVLAMLETLAAALVADPLVSAVERTRALSQLGLVALRAIEQAELAARLEAVERALKKRDAP